MPLLPTLKPQCRLRAVEASHARCQRVSPLRGVCREVRSRSRPPRSRRCAHDRRQQQLELWTGSATAETSALATSKDGVEFADGAMQSVVEQFKRERCAGNAQAVSLMS